MLALIMIFGLMPAPVFAEAADDYADSESYNDYEDFSYEEPGSEGYDNTEVNDDNTLDIGFVIPENPAEENYIDVSYLLELISKAQALDQGNFTVANWTALQLAILEAIIVHDDSNATQLQIDESIANLRRLMDAESHVNTEDLTAVIAEAKSLNEEDYTPESRAVLRLAILEAIMTLDNIEANQAEIDKAARDLRDALHDLEKLVSIAPASDETITVFITFEGYNLGHGFYIEPAAVTVPVGSAAADVTIAFQNENPHLGRMPDWVTHRGGMASGFYMEGIRGFNRGFVNLPPYLANRTPWVNSFNWNDVVEGGDLLEFHFTSTSGWMITVNHTLLPVGAGSWIVNDGDVIRWQFTVYGLGADVGINSGWGNAPPFIMQDRTALIRALFAPNITASARNAALAISINPLATEEQISWVTELLLSGDEAPASMPASIDLVIPSNVFRGSNEFSAQVLGELGEVISGQNIVVTIEQGGINPVNIHPDTVINNGVLHISPAQELGTIALRAASGELNTVVNVTIARPNITTVGAQSRTVLQGDTLDLPLNVTGNITGFRVEWHTPAVGDVVSENHITAIISNNGTGYGAHAVTVRGDLATQGTAIITMARLEARLIDEVSGNVVHAVHYNIRVTPVPTGLIILPENVDRVLTQGTTLALPVMLYPEYSVITGFTIARTIENTSVATIPVTGALSVNATAAGAGTTTSTAQLMRDGVPVGDPVTFNITVNALSGLHILPANVNRTVVEGAAVTMPVQIMPGNAAITGNTIIRASSDTSIATTATGNGLSINATGVRAGEITISAQLSRGGNNIGEPVYFNITVTPVLARISDENISIDADDQTTLTVAQNVTTLLGVNRFVRWESSDESIVSVQNHTAPTNAATANITLNNEITAVSAGTATVTAQLIGGTAANRTPIGTPMTFAVTVGIETSDKDDLNNIIYKAEGLIQANYTPASWAVLETALANAIEIRNNAGAAQEQVNEAVAALCTAIDALEQADSPLTAAQAAALIELHNFTPQVQAWNGTAANTRNVLIASVRTQVESLVGHRGITVTNLTPWPNNFVTLPNPAAGGNAPAYRRFRAAFNDGGPTTTADFYVNVEFLHQAAISIRVMMAMPQLGGAVAANSTVQFNAEIEPAAIPQNVIWSVAGHENAQINESGILSIGEVPLGYKLVITATRVATAGDSAQIYAEFTAAVSDSLTEWVGSGTESNPFLISSAEELALVAFRVNDPNSNSDFRGAHYRLTASITLDAYWEPIGVAVNPAIITNANIRTPEFEGVFDGNGHTITFAHGSRALFGAIWFNTTIRNLNIYGPYIADNGLISGTSATMPFGNQTHPVIDNVRILSGTTIRRSGFAGEDGLRAFQLDIRNSTVEKGVRIGWSVDADAPFEQSIGYNRGSAGVGPGVGSFVSGLAGFITNSVSYATVYGQNNVGGLVGYKAQSMRFFEVENSHFHGTVIATGNHAGGIVGAGYGYGLAGFMAAPNSPGASIRNSTVTGSITGNDFVGGITGAEFANQMWSTGTVAGPQHIVTNNHFSGNITATAAYARNIGGIFGYIRSLNRNNVILGNTFTQNSGAARGIGHVTLVDTIYANPTAIAGTTYFTTQGTAARNPVPPGFGGISRRNYYRSDDPLGTDADALAQMVTSSLTNLTAAEAAALISSHNFGTAVQPWLDTGQWTSAGDTRNAAIAAVRAEVEGLVGVRGITVTNVRPWPDNFVALPNPDVGGSAATNRTFRATFNDGGPATVADFTIDLEFLHAAATDITIRSAMVQPVENVVAANTATRFNADVAPLGIPQNVTWRVTGHAEASINADGILTVGAVPIDTQLTITATRIATLGDATLLSGTLIVTVVEHLSEWAGSGTAQEPFLISNAAELMLLAHRVNVSPIPANNSGAGAGAFAGVHFRVTADIQLGNDWQPIGTPFVAAAWVNPNQHQGTSFEGIFDGGGHTIRFAHGSQPLFGAVWHNAEIRNINIYGPYIAGHGLIAGVAAQFSFGTSAYVLIDNVRILSGTTIRGSGFAGTDGFRPQQLDIRNSTVEAGVRIGFDAAANVPFDQNTVYFASTAGTGPGVGSFVSGLAGSITNSVSYATVYGHPNVRNVGGLVGYKQQSMRSFLIDNSHFRGTVNAPQSLHVGGILGAGYDSPNQRNSAPHWQLVGSWAANNSPGENIRNSTVTGTVIGYDFVGGIVGGAFGNQIWSDGGSGAHHFHAPGPNMPEHNVINNHFNGTLTATRTDTRNIGGIFGYIRSLNRNNNISGNTFTAGSADRGIGHVSIIDTIHSNPTAIAGTTYFNTQGSSPGAVAGFGLGGFGAGAGRADYYRTDDPLGADLDALVRVVGTIVVPVDRNVLNLAIASAELRIEDNYTPNSWTAMQMALISARSVRNDADATQVEVDTVAVILNSAVAALVPRADATMLNAAISAAQSRVQANYTVASWNAMQTQLIIAINIRNNVNATQIEVNNAANNLNAAINALAAAPIVNIAALNSEITRAEGRVQANYTDESWSAMQAQLAFARSVRNNANATQLQVDMAADSLRAAIDALVRAAANRTALLAAIAEAESLTALASGNNTFDSARWSGWSNMLNALASAGTVNADGNAVQAQIDSAATALNNARNALSGQVWLSVTNPNARQGHPSHFFTGRYITIIPGETAYSVLRRPDVGLNIRSTGHHAWAGMYVEAINGWGEFDGGPLSGWMYSVNGVFPMFSASLFYLNPGDRVEWQFTYEVGDDLPGGNIFGPNRQPLRNTIERAQRRVQANYTPASWAPFQTALEAAISERDRASAEQYDIDRVLNALNIADDNLVLRVTVNRDALIALIARVEAITSTNYTAASWARVANALATARDVRDNPNATEQNVDAALRDLQDAINALVIIGSVDRVMLYNEIAQAQSRVQANYTAASWAAMQTALTAAIIMRDNANASQVQVNSAANNLRIALNGLVTVSGVNVAALSDGIARTEARNRRDYTNASWAAMQAALTTARQVRNNPNATQAEIDQAARNLTAAVNALVREAGPNAPLSGPTAPRITIVSVAVEIEAVTANDRTAFATVGSEVISNLIVRAREERATNIEITIIAPEDVVRVETELTVNAKREIAADGLSLTLRSDAAVITIDAATLAGLAIGEADGAVARIAVEILDVSNDLNISQQAVVGNNKAIDLTIMIGENTISNFNGTIMVAIPYLPNIPVEDHDLLTIYHIDSYGNTREMIGAGYSGSQITFMTNHFSIFFVSEWISPFADVTRYDWHFRNVRFAYSNGLMGGIGNGEFAPNTILSRGMAVAMLWRLEGMPIVTDGNAFHDVSAGRWYSDAIAWASANGIAGGYGNGMFGPNDNITREQLAVIFRNYAAFIGQSTNGGMLVSEFADTGNISPWAREAMEWANTNGIITARTLTTLAPDGTVTRAESAAILRRFIEIR